MEQLLTEILHELRWSNVGSLWTLDDIAAHFALSKSSVSQRIVCKPDFPSPVLIGKSWRWYPKEIKAWERRQPRRR